MISGQFQIYNNKLNSKIVEVEDFSVISIVGWFKVYNLNLVGTTNFGYVVGSKYNYYINSSSDTIFLFRADPTQA